MAYRTFRSGVRLYGCARQLSGIKGRLTSCMLEACRGCREPRQDWLVCSTSDLSDQFGQQHVLGLVDSSPYGAVALLAPPGLLTAYFMPGCTDGEHPHELQAGRCMCCKSISLQLHGARWLLEPVAYQPVKLMHARCMHAQAQAACMLRRCCPLPRRPALRIHTAAQKSIQVSDKLYDVRASKVDTYSSNTRCWRMCLAVVPKLAKPQPVVQRLIMHSRSLAKAPCILAKGEQAGT